MDAAATDAVPGAEVGGGDAVAFGNAAEGVAAADGVAIGGGARIRGGRLARATGGSGGAGTSPEDEFLAGVDATAADAVPGAEVGGGDAIAFGDGAEGVAAADGVAIGGGARIRGGRLARGCAGSAGASPVPDDEFLAGIDAAAADAVPGAQLGRRDAVAFGDGAEGVAAADAVPACPGARSRGPGSGAGWPPHCQELAGADAVAADAVPTAQFADRDAEARRDRGQRVPRADAVLA